ncbi:MAG TPA: PGPGW domain-containing protein [Kofleriaceae bacterium]|nr:PGPGW domain-containing protein [Kofleriaceae bacterium]
MAGIRPTGPPFAFVEAMLESAKHEWKSFKEDEAGERFSNHHRRAQRKGLAGRIARVAIGALLIAGGIFLLFVPGPGLLVMLFGVALLAGESRWLAERMDRLEIAARRTWRRVRTRIRRRRSRQPT